MFWCGSPELLGWPELAGEPSRWWVHCNTHLFNTAALITMTVVYVVIKINTNSRLCFSLIPYTVAATGSAANGLDTCRTVSAPHGSMLGFCCRSDRCAQRSIPRLAETATVHNRQLILMLRRYPLFELHTRRALCLASHKAEKRLDRIGGQWRRGMMTC